MSKTKVIGTRVVVAGLLLLLGVASAGAVLKNFGWLGKRAATNIAEQSDPVRNIKFAVYDAGIFPEEMEIEAGRVSIVFDDRTGKNREFVVQRVSGNSPEPDGRVRATKDHWRTRTQLRVTPGRYRVFVGDKPEIQSTLIVKP